MRRRRSARSRVASASMRTARARIARAGSNGFAASSMRVMLFGGGDECRCRAAETPLGRGSGGDPEKIRVHLATDAQGGADRLHPDRPHSVAHGSPNQRISGETTMPRIRITDEYALVKRKGSENWYLEWRERGEKVRRTTGTGCVESAKVKARDIILETARIADQKPAEMPVRVVISRYMALHGSKIASRSSTRHCAKLWEQFFAHDSVADLRPARLREFTAWLEAKEFSAGYIRRIMAIGKAALN